MSSSSGPVWSELQQAVTMLVEALESMQPDKAGQIDAETVSKKLFQDFPSQFEAVHQFGVMIPAARITRCDGTKVLIEIEIFDIEAWPTRHQYDLNNARNARVQVSIGSGRTAPVLSPVWLLREKIITQHQRSGSPKERSDLEDIRTVVDFVEGRSLVMESEEEIQALKALLEKKLEWKKLLLEEAVECPVVFGN